MRYWMFFLGLFVVSLAAVSRPPYEPERVFDVPQDQSGTAALDRAQALLASEHFSQGVPGVSLAVVTNRDDIVSWAGGAATAWGSRDVSEDTRFEAASLSKPVTAYAALRLVEQGRLDLDEAYEAGGVRFTLRQALSHSAGFDNALGDPPAPVLQPGSFRYAGSGYLWIGHQIEQATGRSFQDYMNSVVLPELGMENSHFGSLGELDDQLASPHISVVTPFFVAVTTSAFTALVLLFLHAGARRMLGRHGAAGVWVPRGIVLFSLTAGFALAVLLFGQHNAPILLAGMGLLLLLVGTAVPALRQRHVSTRIVGVVLMGCFLVVLAFRPPLPLQERSGHFLPAAGLRTTAGDYALFLSELMSPDHLDPQLAAEMLTPQVEVNADHDWGLGVGLARGETTAVWHWGINFPGYQALAVAWPERGEAAVILTNGGPMSVTHDGMRYSGLELARTALAEAFGGYQSAYWQGVQ